MENKFKQIDALLSSLTLADVKLYEAKGIDSGVLFNLMIVSGNIGRQQELKPLHLSFGGSNFAREVLKDVREPHDFFTLAEISAMEFSKFNGVKEVRAHIREMTVNGQRIGNMGLAQAKEVVELAYLLWPHLMPEALRTCNQR